MTAPAAARRPPTTNVSNSLKFLHRFFDCGPGCGIRFSIGRLIPPVPHASHWQAHSNGISSLHHSLRSAPLHGPKNWGGGLNFLIVTQRVKIQTDPLPTQV